jgi:ring-1,2-phenylacetyl-CoA epoxidase subunit PaaC
MTDATHKKALLEIVLRLGDNALILGHRLSEWCSKGPILEEDLALANIALDYIGQSRILLTYAGELEGSGKTEDDWAFWRLSADYRNALLVEQANGDFAVTMARQLYYTAFADLAAEKLLSSKDSTLASYAGKAKKELAYHLRHCNEWVIRLGDGTEESHQRMQKGLDDLWMYTGDLFATTADDKQLVADGTIPDFESLQAPWLNRINDTITRATLTVPQGTWMQRGSREGIHTEKLSYLLGEMQSLARAYPGASW